jgi:hypothetical protein
VGRALLERRQNDLQHAIEVANDLCVPEPDDMITTACQLDRTLGIGLLLSGVLTAVKFDHQLARRAGEVDYAASDRVLAAKLPLRASAAQRSPKLPLDVCGAPSQLACDYRPRS